MEVRVEVFQWMLNNGIFQGLPPINDLIAEKNGDRYTLSPLGTEMFETGFIFARIAAAFAHKRGIQINPNFTAYEGYTRQPQTKLYNWTMIADSLKRFGFNLDNDTKTLIVAGDVDVMTVLLDELQSHLVQQERQQQQKQQQQQQQQQPHAQKGKAKKEESNSYLAMFMQQKQKQKQKQQQLSPKSHKKKQARGGDNAAGKNKPTAGVASPKNGDPPAPNTIPVRGDDVVIQTSPVSAPPNASSFPNSNISTPRDTYDQQFAAGNVNGNLHRILQEQLQHEAGHSNHPHASNVDVVHDVDELQKELPSPVPQKNRRLSAPVQRQQSNKMLKPRQQQQQSQSQSQPPQPQPQPQQQQQKRSSRIIVIPDAIEDEEEVPIAQQYHQQNVGPTNGYYLPLDKVSTQNDPDVSIIETPASAIPSNRSQSFITDILHEDVTPPPPRKPQSQPSKTQSQHSQYQQPQQSQLQQPQQPLRDIASAKTCLDFLVITMCHNFDINVTSAISLLTTNTREFNELIIYGEHRDPTAGPTSTGDFGNVLGWFKEILAKIKFLSHLIADEASSVGFALGTIAVGFQSEEFEVVDLVCKIFTHLAYGLKLHKNLSQNVWEWFTSYQGGLDALLYSIHRHKLKHTNEIKLVALSVLYQFSRDGHFRSLFADELTARLSEPLLYIDFVHTFLNFICNKHSCKEELIQQDAAGYLLHYTLNCCEPHNSINIRTAAFIFLKTLWESFPELIQAETTGERIMQQFKQACLDSAKESLQITVHTILFHLLQFLTHEADSNAALIYKILLISLEDNFHDQTLRAHILANFGRIIEKFARVPIAKLIQIFIKRTWDIGYNNLDFNFYLTLSKHQRLGTKNGVLLLDSLERICTSDPLYARVASVPFLIVLKRFCNEKLIQDFVETFTKDLLQHVFMGASTSQKRQQLDNPVLRQRSHILTSELERVLAVEILSKIIFLKKQQYNVGMSEQLLNVKQQYFTANGHDDPDILKLLGLLGSNVVGPNALIQNSGNEETGSQENDKQTNDSGNLYQRLKEDILNSVNEEQASKIPAPSNPISAWMRGIESPSTMDREYSPNSSALLTGPSSATSTAKPVGQSALEKAPSEAALFSPTSAKRQLGMAKHKRRNSSFEERPSSATSMLPPITGSPKSVPAKKPFSHDGVRHGKDHEVGSVLSEPLPKIRMRANITSSQRLRIRQAEIENVRKKREAKLAEQKQKEEEQRKKEERLRKKFGQMYKALRQAATVANNDSNSQTSNGSSTNSRTSSSTTSQRSKQEKRSDSRPRGSRAAEAAAPTPKAAEEVKKRVVTVTVPVEVVEEQYVVPEDSGLSEAQRAAMELFDEIMYGAIGEHYLAPRTVTKIVQKEEQQIVIEEELPGATEESNDNKQQQQQQRRQRHKSSLSQKKEHHDTNKQGFFAQFRPEQRADAIFARDLLYGIIKSVESGEAALRLKMKEEAKKRKKMRKLPAYLLQPPKGPISPTNGEKKESATEAHKKKLEEQKEQEKRIREALERERLKAIQARKEENSKKLQEYRERKQKEEQEAKAREEQAKKEEEERIKRERKLAAKKRKEEKERIEQYKKQLELEQQKREQEQKERELREAEERKKSVEEFQKRKKEKEHRINSAIKIQRAWRKYKERKAAAAANAKKKKKKKLLKQQQQQQQPKAVPEPAAVAAAALTTISPVKSASSQKLVPKNNNSNNDNNSHVPPPPPAPSQPQQKEEDVQQKLPTQEPPAQQELHEPPEEVATADVQQAQEDGETETSAQQQQQQQQQQHVRFSEEQQVLIGPEGEEEDWNIRREEGTTRQ